MSRPTVTVGDQIKTPTQHVVEDANGVKYVTDAQGRKIGVRRVNMSIRRRVFKAISEESSRNSRYLGLVMVAALVVSIDGKAVDAFIRGGNETAFDALIDRLDDDGFEAIGELINPKEVDRDEIKNSSPTETDE